MASATHRGLSPGLAMVVSTVARFRASAWQIELNQIRQLPEMFAGGVWIAQHRLQPVMSVVLRAGEQKAGMKKPAPCGVAPLPGLIGITAARAKGQQMQIAAQQL